MELCIDFGGSELKLGILDRGVVVRTSAVPVDAAGLESAGHAANRLIEAASAEPDAVGIAVPGVVDRAAGRLVKAHDKQPELAGVDLVAWARTGFGLPAVIENDARAALVGEINTGSAAGSSDAVLMTLGTGIGTAAVMDGVLLRGAHDHAGILGGHLTVDLDAGPCNCGNAGCAESLAGAWALRRELARRDDAVTDVRELLAAADDGDPAAVALRDRAIRVWGACAVSLCHAYDPRVVILSGGIMRAGADLAAPIEAYVREHLWTSSHRPQFVVPDRPDLSVLRGLSVLAAESISRGALVSTPSPSSEVPIGQYVKRPTVPLPAGSSVLTGAAAWLRAAEAATGRTAGHAPLLVVDAYPGADVALIGKQIAEALPDWRVVDVEAAAARPTAELDAFIAANLTEDRVFGVMSHATLDAFYDADRLAATAAELAGDDRPTVLLGWGADLVARRTGTGYALVLADMARWEIQLRQRAGATNWRAGNPDEDRLRKYKRGFFVEWRVADRHKRTMFDRLDFVFDANAVGAAEPVGREAGMITGAAFRAAIEAAAHRPLRVVPFFDPGVWGGQWMKRRFGLDEARPNYAWCFDCVPEENSLLLADERGGQVEVPSLDLVLMRPEELLGERTFARFGAEFPIRTDFLDTMEGGNLSLQVHPLTDYIFQTFGMHYTQDESYYLLDAGDDAVVYLGTKDDVDPEAMFDDLRVAQTGERGFDAEKYVNAFPAKKHDHFLIPAGTVHSSGANSMVLEISATPFIFTFKMWDWGRLGLDGIPRPVHLDHAERNMRFDRDRAWTEANLVGRVEELSNDGDVVEERTGLHELEFIEVRRHWFSRQAVHDTGGTVNVLNLVEGDEVEVASPTGAFEPYQVHYAETFIVPASVGPYVIRRTARSRAERFATITASIRGTRTDGP